jgi:hypothetical protein
MKNFDENCMKCPDCSAVLDGKDICGECGKKIEMPGQEVEIEYKEFKISEFLEIRKKQERSHTGPVPEKTIKDIKNTRVKSYGPSGPEFRENKYTGTVKEQTDPPARNNLFLIVIMITVIAAVMAGAIYLPRFFSQQ